ANARAHCWTAGDAHRFLDDAKADRPQVAAFCALALDTGARRSELARLTWGDVDLDAGTLTIERQLDAAGVAPHLGRPRPLARDPSRSGSTQSCVSAPISARKPS